MINELLYSYLLHFLYNNTHQLTGLTSRASSHTFPLWLSWPSSLSMILKRAITETMEAARVDGLPEWYYLLIKLHRVVYTACVCVCFFVTSPIFFTQYTLFIITLLFNNIIILHKPLSHSLSLSLSLFLSLPPPGYVPISTTSFSI